MTTKAPKATQSTQSTQSTESTKPTMPTITLPSLAVSANAEYAIGILDSAKLSEFCRNALVYKNSRNSRCAFAKACHSMATQKNANIEVAHEIAYILQMSKIAEVFSHNSHLFNQRVLQNEKGVLTVRDFVTLCFGNGDTAKLRSIANA